MKIVALTDIHGAYARATKILQRELPDLLLIGGDLTTVGSVKEAEGAIAEFQKIVPDVLCVAGNMDLPEHDMLFDRLDLSLNGHGKIRGGIGFFGVSAAPLSPLHTVYELSEEEITRRIAKGYGEVAAAARKIFVPHAPPYGTRLDIIRSGLHVGSTAVREFVEDFQPELVICGHIHESYGQEHLGQSKLVNCGPAMNGHYCVVHCTDQILVESKTH